MKNNTIILIMLTILLIGFNAKLLLKAKDQESASNSKYKELQKELEQNEKRYRNNFHFETQNEQLYLDKNLKLIGIDGDTVFAKNVFNNAKLVLRYTESNCRMCIDAEHDILIQNANNIKENVAVLSTYDRLRGAFMDAKKLAKSGLKNIEIYLVPYALKLPLEQQNIPYYFVVNKNLRVSSLLVPAKEDPKLSMHYVKSILKNLNHEK
ncbi:hypothetical protein UMM65_15895 [Aureibaculum sp. 2210JD6-5]|uniref:hypothetical protein n=1 Tax=Aureibaculum sp. 2210JD6-5 TaxID=3103957 RepID=UPI002AAC8DBD|nr:hypothetical protein [Aureibaculum sp. 2210JD6-5]MDY7396731.1 hypothetical protein [Aureibaculum sp. 2210JD6-5]